MDSEKKFTEHLSNSLIHFLYQFFIYYNFVFPIHLWKKSVIRLSEQKEKGSLNVDKSTSPWPILSFIKTFFLEFCLDSYTFLCYIVGPLIAVVWIIYGIITDTGAGQLFISVVGFLILCYWAPIYTSLIRDLCQLLLLPFRKLISWLSKPAQYMDLKIENNPAQSVVTSPPNN